MRHFEIPAMVYYCTLQVHVRTWKCASVSCNCGIAAREGDDVIVVDMCRDRIPRVRFASKSEPSHGTSVRRDNNGRSFVVCFMLSFIATDNSHTNHKVLEIFHRIKKCFRLVA